MNEYRRIVVSFFVIVVMILVLAICITDNQERLDALEQSTLSMDDWTEGCYETETVNRSRIVDPSGDGCDTFCDGGEICEIIADGMSVCYRIKIDTKSCYECFDKDEPYIYTWQETFCVRTMLISSDVRVYEEHKIMSDTYGK